MFRDERISLVIPCLDEEKGIGTVIRIVPPFVDEVVVVDNGSTDRTAAVAAELGATVVSEPHRGYGRALKSGFNRVAEGIIITLDGDGTYPCRLIEPALDHFLDGSYDFISCRRYLENREPSLSTLKRFLGNLALTLSFRLIYGIALRDSQSGMWIFHRKLLEEIELKSDGMALSEEIKIETFCRSGFRAGEFPVPYTHKARVGPSKLRPWRDGLGNLAYLLTKRRDLKGRRNR
jgi:glycosyltransferase involved in cell wall biosynthesis